LSLVLLSRDCPWLFWSLAIGWSAAQATAGYLYGQYICNKARPDAGEWITRAYGLHHAALYFVSSFAGFLAWALVVLGYGEAGQWQQASNGMVTLLALVGVFVVLAISGALARILYTGTKPW
jgi:hypothetical protein